MPTCNECLAPCNCSIEEDGYWANRPQDGRRNVVVDGSGSVQDPVTISFMQSELFRPEAAEVQVSSKNISNNTSTIITPNDYDITVYQTPNVVLIRAAGLGVSPFITLNNYWIVGASATFPANATGIRHIQIETEDDTTPQMRVAGNVQTAVSTASSVLSCSGYVSGFFSTTLQFDGILYKKASTMVVAVRQNSGAPMVVSQIKLWVTMI